MKLLGKFVAYILESKRGQKYFQIDSSGDKIYWTEKGLNRFILTGMLITWASFFTVLSLLFGLRYRMILSAIILSLYFKEKYSPVFVKLLDGIDDFNIDKEPPIEETTKFNIIKDVFNGVKLNEAIKRNTE